MFDLSVLVVEDDVNFQSNMRILFDGVVKNLYQAYDGEEGLELFKKYKPDVVITDIEMPKKNGLEMAKEIKNISDAYVIIISAYDNKEYMLDAINYVQVDGYIIKPIDVVELFALLENISDKIAENKLFEDMVFLDHLTKVFNRRGFEEKLNELLKKDQPFALFFIDVDDFKTINDKYGHKIGDDVLKFVAESIKKVTRKEDFVARVGGDEFVLIVEDIDKEKAEDIANAILSLIDQGVNTFKGKISVSCSIGVSVYPEDSRDKDMLLSLADRAMYKVKKEGKHGVSTSW